MALLEGGQTTESLLGTTMTTKSMTVNQLRECNTGMPAPDWRVAIGGSKDVSFRLALIQAAGKDHPAIKASDADIATMVKFVLAQ